MKDTARIARHPIHPMLIPFPIGLWIFSLAADIIYRAGGGDIWSSVAYFSIAGGVIGAIIAAVPGFVDYVTMPRSYVKKIALWHMLINVTALVLFIIDFFVRRGRPDAVGPFLLSIIGVILIIISGWLGGKMVYVHGMAVDETEVCRPGEGIQAHGAKG